MNYVDPKLIKAEAPGEARCPAITTQEIIAGDAVPAPGWVRSESYTFLGDEDVSADRYTRADYAQGEVERMVYRFLPDRHDHRKSTMEVLFLRPMPTDGSAFETAEMQVLRDDQSFCEAEGMDPGFGGILDQDTDNLLLQQEGLEAASKKSLTLGNYQEVRIRHCERALDRYMAMPPLEVDWRTQQKCGKH